MLTTVYCLFKHRAKVAAQGRRLGFTVSYDRLSMKQLSRAAIRLSDGSKVNHLVPVFWHWPEDKPLTKTAERKLALYRGFVPLVWGEYIRSLKKKA